MALEQEIEELEREIRETSKNKATESHLGRLKAKLAATRKLGSGEKTVQICDSGDNKAPRISF